jgi:hypothetical protein
MKPLKSQEQLLLMRTPEHEYFPAVKIFVVILLVISALASCATNRASSRSGQNDECALAGRAFYYSCISRR